MNEKEKRAWGELDESWNRLKGDRTQGAAELLRSALIALRKFLHNVENPDSNDIELLMTDLAQLRMDMAGFRNCVRFINTATPDSLLKSVIQLEEYLAQTPVMIAENAVHLMRHTTSVMTNSRSSVVEQSILSLHRAGKLKQVIQMESRPAYEGRRNAEKLLECGIHVTMIPDAAMGYWINNADVVLVGADAIAVDGNFIGKIGCHPLALTAREAGVEYYVAAERLKFVHELPDEDEINKHFKDDLLGWEPASERLALSNIIFEITSGKHVNGFLTEYGLQRPPLSVLETLSF